MRTGFGVVLLVVYAVVKDNSANHALLLFDDTMTALACGGLLLIPETHRLRNTDQPTEGRRTKLAVWG